MRLDQIELQAGQKDNTGTIVWETTVDSWVVLARLKIRPRLKVYSCGEPTCNCVRSVGDTAKAILEASLTLCYDCVCSTEECERETNG